MDATLELSFDWKEVGCFVRPQSILCDQIAPGYGALFLFAASLYHTYGYRGYFVDPQKQHFAFARFVYRALAGIEFNVTRIEAAAQLGAALKRILASGGPAIVPANLRFLPYFSGYRERDQPHYFIVRGFDAGARTLALEDTLHLSADHSGTEYGATAIDEALFETLTAHRWTLPEPSYWILEIRSGEGFERRSIRELMRVMVAEYVRVAGSGALDRALFDERHLAAMHVPYQCEPSSTLERSMRAYLAESNFCSVHLKILLHALRSFGCERIEEVEKYQSAAAALRRNFLIKCMMPRGASREEWIEVRSALVSLDSWLRSSLLSRIGGAHG